MSKDNEKKVQSITVEGKIGKLFTKTLGGDNRMVARTKLEYYTKSAVSDKREHNSKIEIEFWDDIAVKALEELKEGSTVEVTGELFQRRWEEPGVDPAQGGKRSMHRINVFEFKKVSSPGKYAKYSKPKKPTA
jgi:single-stranded DNA-binding protein